MFRRFVFLGVGALALLGVLGAPGQLQAQRFRAGLPPAMRPVMPGGVMTRFPIGVNPGFNRGFGPRFNPAFNRSFNPRFTPGFNRSFDRDFNRGFFDPRFNGGFFNPTFSPGFGPVFFRPF
jgi:hypothetical protein